MKGRQGQETPAPAVDQAICVAETGRRAGGGHWQHHCQEAEATEEDLRRKERGVKIGEFSIKEGIN